MSVVTVPSSSSAPASAVAGVALMPAGDMAWMEQAKATEIVEWASDRFGSRLCLAASFTDTVLIDVAMSVDPDIPVFFADTGFHFAETLATVRKAHVRYELDLRVVRPAPAAASVWADGAEACCGARKVAPLLRTMAEQGFSAWLTGLRRAESASRFAAPIVSADSIGLTKIAPLANWSDDDVERRIAERGLPVNPLIEQGYPSIGCWPCTEPAFDGDSRSGRWRASNKTECGLHVNTSSNRILRAIGEGGP